MINPRGGATGDVGRLLASFFVGEIVAGMMSRSRAAAWSGRQIAPALAMLASPRMRSALRANARSVLPAGSTEATVRRTARGMVRSHYDFVVDVARTSRMRRSQIEARIGEIRGERHFSDARARGRGVILLTAHFGSFEVGAAALTRIEPGVHIVFQRDPFPAFERFRARSRRTLGLLEAPIDDGPATWLRLRDALAAGGSVLMQGDLAMPGQGAMESQIGAGRIMLPTGPYRLSTMTGAAVIPVFAPRRRDGRVDLIIKAPIECAPHGDVGGAVAAMAASLTEIISRHPEQWIMPRAVFLP